MTSYTQLLTILESFASNHLEVKRFKSDFLAELGNFGTEEKSYPILYCTPTNGTFNAEESSDYTQFTLTFYALDLINDNRSNINTILNTTSLILNDLHKYFKDGDIPGIDLVSASQIQPVNNYILDYASGWFMTLTLEVNTYSVCEIPFRNAPVIPVSECDIIYDSWRGPQGPQGPAGIGSLQNGNATTINGSSVDWGGDLTSDVFIDGLTGTSSIFLGSYGPDKQLSMFSVGANNGISLFNYENNVISSSFSLLDDYAMMSSGLNGTSSVIGGNAYMASYDNRRFVIAFPFDNGLTGTGETFTINGVTFTEGIDFSAQGDPILDAAAIAALDYSGVTDFISVEYNPGDAYVYFNFSTSATTSTTLSWPIGYLSENLFSTQVNTSSNGLFLTTGNTGLIIDNGGANVFRDFTSQVAGIQYDADYSATYTNRSLVDKEFVTKYYGQIYSQTPQILNIVTQGVYVPFGITGIFDTSKSNGTAISTTETFGIKNTSGKTKLFQVIATTDVELGSNKTAAFRLGINGTSLPETTCVSQTGNHNLAKLMTQWIVELQDGDDLTLHVANLSNNDDIQVDRSKVVIISI